MNCSQTPHSQFGHLSLDIGDYIHKFPLPHLAYMSSDPASTLELVRHIDATLQKNRRLIPWCVVIGFFLESSSHCWSTYDVCRFACLSKATYAARRNYHIDVGFGPCITEEKIKCILKSYKIRQLSLSGQNIGIYPPTVSVLRLSNTALTYFSQCADLVELTLHNMTGSLADPLQVHGNFTKPQPLKVLNIYDCPSLHSLKQLVSEEALEGLENLIIMDVPLCQNFMTPGTLQMLNFHKVDCLTTLLGLDEFSSLTYIRIAECNNLLGLDLGALKNLTGCSVQTCLGLLSMSVANQKTLKSCQIWGCKSLLNLDVHDSSALKTLMVLNSPSLECVNLECTFGLCKLTLQKVTVLKLLSVPDSVDTLILNDAGALETLTVGCDSQLKFCAVQNCATLPTINVQGCIDLVTLTVKNMVKLSQLMLGKKPKLRRFLVSGCPILVPPAGRMTVV
jgi:hypothetical protein